MENYFQAEAFNLDKVLDEFEQNEEGEGLPSLSDAKWTKILAPPPLMLPLPPALAEPRPLKQQAPPPPQPNMGKFVGRQAPPPLEGSPAPPGQPDPAPSKEESVTEEKEREESREEGGSTPCGGARPKQPISPASGPPSRNKNHEGDEAGSPNNDLQGALGGAAPVWVPDSDAPACMKCSARFTFTRRRHHCRACGKVFCAACSGFRCKLLHLDGKEARVCITCHSALTSGLRREQQDAPPAWSNPAECCSVLPPLLQTSGSLCPVPPTGVGPVAACRTPRADALWDQRKAWRADEVLTNGETAEPPKAPPPSPAPPEVALDPPSPAGSPIGSDPSLIPPDGLPPILISTGVKGDYAVEERPSEFLLMQQLEDGRSDPLVFVLNANLLAMVKIVNYVNRKCWYLATKGMHAVGQSEVVVLLQCLPDEKTVPKDVFTHFIQLYQEALSGRVLSPLGHFFFSHSFLGSREHAGFLYVSPSHQTLPHLPLPDPPLLFALLIQKWEAPWAKVFPLRLMLRLGAEYRFYPCPLFSVRFRTPLFGETAHTIMNLLADFRNYQYTLPVVRGLVVDMELKKTCIRIPCNRYEELMKAMNQSNEHVLALAACFNQQADSHLVCVQNEDGNYQTQAISIQHRHRTVTGACFFVFSGALKTSSGYLAKTSIVEDGVMVQVTMETMEALRQALRDMKDFSVACGPRDHEEKQEQVHLLWVEDEPSVNKGVVSPIDGRSMESVTSIKIFHGAEFKANSKIIHWTEVFFLHSDEQASGLSDPADHSRLTDRVARAFCRALGPRLQPLKEDGMAKLGLRLTLDSDQVGYLAGSNGQLLPSRYLNGLDGALMPVLHAWASQLSEGPIAMELVFYILEVIS